MGHDRPVLFLTGNLKSAQVERLRRIVDRHWPAARVRVQQVARGGRAHIPSGVGHIVIDTRYLAHTVEAQARACVSLDRITRVNATVSTLADQLPPRGADHASA